MTENTEIEKIERDKLLRKAYGQATQDLRDLHRADFDDFYSKRAAENGVEWTPRKSPEQKAIEEFNALIEQFPFLAQQAQGEDVAGDDADTGTEAQ